MNKLLFGLAIALLPLAAHAQFQIGVKGGINLSRLSFGNFVSTGTNTNGSPTVDVNGQTFRDNLSESLNSRTGTSFGIYTRFGKNLFIQPELLYTNLSGQFDVLRNGKPETVTIQTTSFDVPVLLGLKGGPLRIVAGPMASFRIDNNAGLSDALKQYTGGTLNDAWQKAYYGYQVGGGLDLGSLGLDVRYQGNLSDIAQINSASGSFGQRAKSWQITLAYKIF
ncbi:outer membrane beta-barrel protein [Fibrella sp. HMF5335]|uniref:Outer membrane beta-barrel protein n=1 Tax=Fibrella rubiginis TaxID=2817060 RepID=A0A939GGF9_9BACT|nr:outer membrane beta-barrel protein [Fibrella rubiginis]MBO0935988.1 outer membrane beta-barrel protein [Fibrella rubiginis]